MTVGKEACSLPTGLRTTRWGKITILTSRHMQSLRPDSNIARTKEQWVSLVPFSCTPTATSQSQVRASTQLAPHRVTLRWLSNKTINDLFTPTWLSGFCTNRSSASSRSKSSQLQPLWIRILATSTLPLSSRTHLAWSRHNKTTWFSLEARITLVKCHLRKRGCKKRNRTSHTSRFSQTDFLKTRILQTTKLSIR